MDKEEFISFIKTLCGSAAQKIEEEKITPDLVIHMSDEELSSYLPHHGERLRLRAYLKNKTQEPQNKKSKLLTILKQKLAKEDSTEDPIPAEMRNPHRPYGNRNAAKQNRLVELGWIHRTSSRSIQVRKNKGGGTRKLEVPKNSTKSSLMEIATTLFFPNGISTKGPASDFNFDLWDFSDRPIDTDVTLADMYDKTKMPLLRFYLSTSQKNHSSDHRSNVTESSTVVNSVYDDAAPQNKTPADVLQTFPDMTPNNDMFDTQTDENKSDILSEAMGIAGIPLSDDENDLPDPISSVVPLEIKEHFLKLHRGHLMHEMIQKFKVIDPFQDIINIDMVMPNGSVESAEDGGGVTRDALSEFWAAFYDQCTIGTKFKIPYLRHDFAEKEWNSVANILVFGWTTCGYFPIQLSLPFLQICLYGKVSTPILDSFFDIIPEDEANTLKQALSDFSSVEQDELIDIH